MFPLQQESYPTEFNKLSYNKMKSATMNQPYSQPTSKFAGSVGGTIKSMLGDKSRTYFTLEHKTQTEKYKVGTTEEFIGDYVELGRGNRYAVSFGEDCSTVSRPHAVIVRQGEGWMLRSLSHSNPTLLNNRPIQGDTFLGNGDQIQLSHKGPKMIFLATSSQKIGTLGLTARFSAMRREVLRPYKAVLAALSLLLIASFGLTLYYDKKHSEADIIQAGQIGKLDVSISDLNKKLVRNDSIENASKAKIAGLMQEIGDLKKTVKNQGNSLPPPPEVLTLIKGLYYIMTESLEINGKKIDLGVSGTGFLLNDGRFVTARHVAMPWLYGIDGSDKLMLALNNHYANDHESVVHNFVAINAHDPSKVLRFSTNKGSKLNENEDHVGPFDIEGTTITLQIGTHTQDWIVFQTTQQGSGLQSGAASACSMNPATQLFALGYPQKSVSKKEDIAKPTYAPLTVGRAGCHEGLLWITDRNIEQGNSGGPVFRITGKNTYEVVGIVSAGIANTQGILVPISSIN
jgi:hypothetical protein